MPRILLRRYTAAIWSSSNPILAQGEPGVATDTGVFKIGDGVTAWNSLSAVAGEALDADLAAIADLTTTEFGRSLLTASGSSAARTLLDAQQTIDSIPQVWLKPFQPTSPFKTAIGSGAVFGSTPLPRPTYVNSVNGYSYKVYRAAITDPLVTIRQNGGVVVTTNIPSTATPQSGSDHSFVVIRPDGHTIDEMWVAVLTTGFVDCNYHVSYDLLDEGLDAGIRAWHSSSIANLPRVEELEAGLIDHPIALGLNVNQMVSGWVWPANSEDDYASGSYTGTIPMGSLLAIKPNVDITALGLSVDGLVFARALQDYGAYVCDDGGGNLFYIEDGSGAHVTRVNNIIADLPLLPQLYVVTNNTAETIGGGGAPRQPMQAVPTVTPLASLADVQAGDAVKANIDSPTFTGVPSGPVYNVTGLNGLSPRKFVGRSTTAGSPSTGFWLINDETIDSNGVIWRCTAAVAPTFVDSTIGLAFPSGGVVVAKPTCTIDDWLYASVITQNIVVSAPSGWTLLASATTAAQCDIYTFRKKIVGGEASSFTFPMAANSQAVALCVSVRNGSDETPAFGTWQGSAAAPTGTVVPLSANNLLLGFQGSLGVSSRTVTPPGGWTEDEDGNAAFGFRQGSLSHLIAGTADPVSVTWGVSSGGGEASTVVVAIAGITYNWEAINTASPTFTGVTTSPVFAATGITGATAASRYVGATASGSPASGAHLKGDWVIDQTGTVYICTTAGTPGTWAAPSGGGEGGAPSGPAGGDLSGSYPNPILATEYAVPTDVAHAANEALAAALFADISKMDRAGDTMTGPLILSGDPTLALQAATRQYVLAQVAALVNGAPGALDTLSELSAALGATPDFASQIVTALGLKAPLASPTFTGTPVGPVFKVSGKNGLSAMTFCGISSSTGAPSSSTWAVGDVVLDVNGVFYRCTVAGTPGTWVGPS